VSQDALLRTIAVVVAVALVAAPYRGLIVERLTQAATAASAYGADLARIAAALLIVAALWGKIPLPQVPGIVDVPTVVVPEPSAELQRLVAPVAQALAGLPADKRQLWAATWSKAAVVVEAEGTTSVPVFTDTPALRLFTTIAIDVAWRRLGDMPPGGVAGLKDAVETAMRSALGLDAVPVTSEMRGRYADVAKAIAWAGTR
jgi:uncharacterized Ntn-hydrolase superfamily protein